MFQCYFDDDAPRRGLHTLLKCTSVRFIPMHCWSWWRHDFRHARLPPILAISFIPRNQHLLLIDKPGGEKLQKESMLPLENLFSCHVRSIILAWPSQQSGRPYTCSRTRATNHEFAIWISANHDRASDPTWQDSIWRPGDPEVLDYHGCFLTQVVD